MDEVKEIFDKFDTNGTEKPLSPSFDPSSKPLASTGPLLRRSKKPRRRSTSMATRAIDLHEFAYFQCATATPDGGGGRGSGKEISDAFQMYDRNKKGLISTQEISDAVKMYDWEMYGWLI